MKKKMRRSFSVPGNVKNPGIRRVNSGLIRVIPVTPRPIPVEDANSSQSDDIEETPSSTILFLYLIIFSVVLLCVTNYQSYNG